MPKNKSEIYKVEVAAEKLLNEFRLWLKDWRRFFFNIPEKEEDRMIYLLITMTWILSTATLIYAMIRR